MEHERGVSVQGREADGLRTVFIMNFTEEKQSITIHESVQDVRTGETIEGDVTLDPYGVLIVEKKTEN